MSSHSHSNLNSLLKNQIKNAVATLYDEQGTAAANRYSHPHELSKALLDLLFPDEAAENTEITGVAKVPTAVEAKSDSEGSTDSKKERKKRAPMSDEAKAAMKAKREATIAAKKGTAPAPEPEVAAPAPAPEAPAKKAKKTKAAPAAPAPAPAANPIIAEVDKVIPPVEAEAPASDDAAESKKDRKPRGPMSDEAKAAMKAKREATIAAKKAAQA